MSFVRLVFVLACVHLVAVALLFLPFGLGLEGPRHLGHALLGLLLFPASEIPGAPCVLIPLNSLAWGFFLAVLNAASESARRRA